MQRDAQTKKVYSRLLFSKYMHEKYDRNKVKLSFRKFNDYASDVLSSNYNTYDTNFEKFFYHCETDEIMSIICNQLNYDNTIFHEWWSENEMGSTIYHVGSKILILPLDENKRDALLFQICLKINKSEIDFQHFCMHFFGGGLEANIQGFNKVFLMPMVR
jgi:hypothetical protein